MIGLTVDELRELVADLAGALIATLGDHEAAEDAEVPLDDDLLRELRQRDAFIATFRRLNDDAKVTKVQLRRIFEEELKRAHRSDGVRLPPLMPEVREPAEELLAVVDRAKIVDRALGNVF